MLRGFTIPQKGLALLAKLHSGSTLEITRVMIGEGQVPDSGNLRDLEDLVAPIAQAASTKPVTVGTTTSFIVQYRNDLNGGLDRDININEYGVFANDPDEGEILLYYANLGAYYEPVPARGPNEPITAREYPVSIGVAEGVEVILGYMASAYMTAEDVEVYCTATLLPMLLDKAQTLIDAHNEDPEAHPYLRGLISGIDSRLSLLELMYNTDVSGNPFTVTFESLDGTAVTGVWNQPLARVEF